MSNRAKRAKAAHLGMIRLRLAAQISTEATRYRVQLLGDGNWIPLPAWEEAWMERHGWIVEDQEPRAKQQLQVITQKILEIMAESETESDDDGCLVWVLAEGGEIAVLCGDDDLTLYEFTHDDMIPEEQGSEND